MFKLVKNNSSSHKNDAIAYDVGSKPNDQSAVLLPPANLILAAPRYYKPVPRWVRQFWYFHLGKEFLWQANKSTWYTRHCLCWAQFVRVSTEDDNSMFTPISLNERQEPPFGYRSVFLYLVFHFTYTPYWTRSPSSFDVVQGVLYTDALGSIEVFTKIWQDHPLQESARNYLCLVLTMDSLMGLIVMYVRKMNITGASAATSQTQMWIIWKLKHYILPAKSKVQVYVVYKLKIINTESCC
jgi:hypothetical protein